MSPEPFNSDAQVGRVRLAREGAHFDRRWRLVWGRRRWRDVCNFFEQPDGRITWHTWDRRGTGGENDTSRSLFAAVEIVIVCLLRQRFVPSITADEARQLLRAAWAHDQERTSNPSGGT